MNTDTDTAANGLGTPLGRPEAIGLLKSGVVGRLIYTSRALPAVMPVSYVVRDGGILIWTGSGFSLVHSLRGAVVAFQVDDLDHVSRSGWSVTVTGMARVVIDGPTLAQARTDGPESWAPSAKDHLVRIPLTMVTGRRFGHIKGLAVGR